MGADMLSLAEARGRSAYMHGEHQEGCRYSQRQYVIAWLKGWYAAREDDRAASQDTEGVTRVRLRSAR